MNFRLWKKSPTVLLIDDDASVRRLIRARLTLHDGRNVICANDASAGLALANEAAPDVILLDWMLPDQAGPEVLAELKAHDNTRHIPVIMLTGRKQMADIEEMFSLGAEAYITKPFEMAKLSDKVRAVLCRS